MKQALILTAIDPLIGGVLVFGERGTGKSTIVRSLTALLPEIKSIKGCPYNCENLNENCSHCSTTSAKKVLAENLKQRAFKEKKIVDDANTVAKSIKAMEIKISAKVASGDKLFGSVNNSDVSIALEKAGQKIEKKFITVTGGNVKRLGKYNAQVRLHRDVTVDLDFEIIAEND